MLLAFRLDIIKLVGMALLFEGHAWLCGDSASMSAEKHFVFVLS